MKHKKLSPKHLSGGVINSKVRFPVLLLGELVWDPLLCHFPSARVLFILASLQKQVCPLEDLLLFHVWPLAQSLACPSSTSLWPWLVWHRHGCPRRAGAEALPAGFSGSCSSVSLIQLWECWIWEIGSCLGMGRRMSASSEAVCNAEDSITLSSKSRRVS